MFQKFMIGFLIVLLLAGCTSTPLAVATALPATEVPSATAMPPISLTDGLNRTVTLAGPAQRLVSLAPANTEILFAVGAGTQVVGRDMFSDYPAEAASIQNIGGSMGEFNLEAILTLQPDLILAQAGGFNPPELIAALEKLGLAVYALPNPTTLEEMFTNLETVGALTGHGSEAAAVVESLTARVGAVDTAILPISSRSSVYYELDATDPTNPYTAGPGSFVDSLIRRAGGSNIGSELEGQWATISTEQLLVVDPSIIILGDAAYGETPEKVAARPGWETLSAVRNGQIFPFDDNLISRPGPRLVDALEALVELLHPGVLK